jgi:hypothetical protein
MSDDDEMLLPPSRSEVHARTLIEDCAVDRLIAIPASIISDLLQDIDTWREIATRKRRAH